MNYRVISLGTYPLQVLNHIRAAGCIVRLEATAVRGSVAFVGDGRVWAVGELRDVKPATRGKDAPQGFLWCFADLRDVEGVSCDNYGLEAMFMNGEKLEPQMLQASANDALNRLFAPSESDAEAVESAVEPAPIKRNNEPEETIPAMPPDYQIAVPKAARRAREVGQLEMF